MCASVVVNPSQEKNMIHKGLTPIVRHVKKMTPKKRRQRTLQAWEAKQALKAKSKNESVK